MTIDVSSDRAEDLSPEQLLDLFVGEGGDEVLVTRLMSPGTHLLQGSRGTGKTMLLRVAHERLKNTPEVVPAFVSFSRYLATSGSTSADQAYSPFHSWVIAKLLQRLLASIGRDQAGVTPIPLEKYVDRLETHYRDPDVGDRATTAAKLGVAEDDLVEFDRLDTLIPRIHRVLDSAGKTSVTFFLDEATQNFAEELQPQFFRIVRHLRNPRVAVKIAVYPQATVYGRDFEVGQDAIVLPVERKVEEAEGFSFMVKFLSRRLAEGSGTTKLQVVQRDFLIKMSGGNPRWLLHLLNRLSLERAARNATVYGVAKDFPDTTLWPYLRGLRTRLVAKRRYVDTALALAQVLVSDLRQLNLSRKTKPTCYVAISQSRELPFRIRAALGLLEYTGLLYRRGPKRIGSRENAQLYLVHPALLVKENALFPLEANPPLVAIVKAFSEPAKDVYREYTKNSPRLLMDVDADDDSATCDYCGAALGEGAKYCHECGRAVTASPLYETLRGASSQELELSQRILQRLADDGRFLTVGAVLDSSADALDSIHYVGDVRARLIKSAAEEFVAG